MLPQRYRLKNYTHRTYSFRIYFCEVRWELNVYSTMIHHLAIPDSEEDHYKWITMARIESDQYLFISGRFSEIMSTDDTKSFQSSNHSLRNEWARSKPWKFPGLLSVIICGRIIHINYNISCATWYMRRVRFSIAPLEVERIIRLMQYFDETREILNVIN